MKTEITLDDVIKRSFNVLKANLAELSMLRDHENLQLSFIYNHSNNIFKLGQEVVFLLDSGRAHSCPLLVRAMYESLFKLVAAFDDRSAAVQIMIYELEEDHGRITKWLDPQIYSSVAEELSRLAKELRNENASTSNKKWNVLACAEASKLDQHYRDAYFHLSSHVHATITGIAVQNETAGMGYILQTMIFVVLCAAIHLTLSVPREASQNYREECGRLGNEWIQMMDSGVFSKMDLNTNLI
jgi:Family of unknown function (DUF5677)